MSNSQPDAPPLVLRDVSKQYSTGIQANRDVTLSAERGEILGLLGPNGAGKTTLVRQITTELFPTSGEIRVFGHDVVTEPDAVKRLMGIVPQEATLFGYLTVYHHLRIFGKLRGLSPRRASERADELVTELRMEEHRNVIADKLSGGLKRRVMIGIAILANPPLMVLDEPTTGLDPQARRNLWSLLRRYRDDGATILLTTHYMEEAEALCDRVGIISHGHLLALDTVANLRASRGYEFKLTYSRDGSTAEPEVIYGSDDGELVERVRSMGINQFTVSQTNLEDVFLALTGGEESLDSDAG
ncbi:MAG: ABC transporter ATP-binding protein [Chloroflexi bacterium]|nr:ABC transporter ATP-binding protein [Chloroflexota bacterium]